MDLDTLSRDKTEHLISIDRVAAFGQLVLNPRQVLVDHQHILVVRDLLDMGRGDKLPGTPHLLMILRTVLFTHHLQILINNTVGIQPFLGYLDVKIGHRLETFLFDVAHQDRFLQVDLPVLETTLQHLLGHIHRFGLLLPQGLFDLYTRLGGHHDVEPIPFGRLRG